MHKGGLHGGLHVPGVPSYGNLLDLCWQNYILIRLHSL